VAASNDAICVLVGVSGVLLIQFVYLFFGYRRLFKDVFTHFTRNREEF